MNPERFKRGIMNAPEIGLYSRPSSLRHQRLYLEDDHCFEAEAKVVAVQENCIAIRSNLFLPGAGVSLLTTALSGAERRGTRNRVCPFGSDAIIWHLCKSTPAIRPCRTSENDAQQRKTARSHALPHRLHVLTRLL